MADVLSLFVWPSGKIEYVPVPPEHDRQPVLKRVKPESTVFLLDAPAPLAFEAEEFHWLGQTFAGYHVYAAKPFELVECFQVAEYRLGNILDLMRAETTLTKRLERTLRERYPDAIEIDRTLGTLAREPWEAVDVPPRVSLKIRATTRLFQPL